MYIVRYCKLKKCHSWILKATLFAVLFFYGVNVSGFGIERFELINLRQGLSQNNINSIYADHEGFLWVGTMNGLNRYDGYNFKVYLSSPNTTRGLTQNRVIRIFEDSLKFLWVVTNDNYYHYRCKEYDTFESFPLYGQSYQEKRSAITVFFQYNKKQIWLGSSETGVYQLVFDSLQNKYRVSQFLKNSESSENPETVHFVVGNPSDDIYIGTSKRLLRVPKESIEKNEPAFETVHSGLSYFSALQTNGLLLVGTSSKGLLCFNLTDRKEDNRFSELSSKIQNIMFLKVVHDNRFLCVGTLDDGLYIYDFLNNSYKCIDTWGNQVQNVYEDSEGILWLKSRAPGLVKIVLPSIKSKHFDLRREKSSVTADVENTILYEDSKDVLWIANHGAGLGWYDRKTDEIKFYQNDPNNINSISSNYVTCVTEDKSGNLWVGTAQANGGINRALRYSSSFLHYIPKQKYTDLGENVVRSLLEDSNGNIWAGTKSGEIHVYRKDMSHICTLTNYDAQNGLSSGYPAYGIMQDVNGYLWLAIKGSGVSVSTQPLGSDENAYKQMKFHNYRNQKADYQSLPNDLAYSVTADHLGQVWIGTYGGGVSRVISRDANRLVCRTYNHDNAMLTGTKVRYVYVDSQRNLWVGSTSGLNVAKILDNGDITPFSGFLFDTNDPQSINYNDVLHILEDSKGRIWITTFGGGVNVIDKYTYGEKPVFRHFTQADGLIDGAVYAVCEDDSASIWFSTENGLSCIHAKNGTILNFSKNRGIYNNNFCENTVCKTSNGNLLFGNLKGIILVNPSNIRSDSLFPLIKLVNLQINNLDVHASTSSSVLTKTIEETKKISLSFKQSSFSIDFIAMELTSPDEIKYRYLLENFDEEWKDAGNIKRATYTNIPPGNYVFRVKSTNRDGLWGDNEAALHIHIAPPIWKTWWFNVLVSLLIVITVVLLLRERERSHKRSKWLLEKRVKERTREIMLQKEKIEEQNRELEKANRMKSRFFSIIAHDLKNPVAGFNQVMDLVVSLHHKLTEEERWELILLASRSAHKIHDLLDELLIWARSQTDKIDYEFTINDLRTLVEYEIDSQEVVFKNKEITVLNRVDESISVLCDNYTIQFVIRNMLINAVKFSPRNETILIGAQKLTDEVHVFVKDNGVGIARELHNKLFNLGERVSGVGTEGEEGTGLGLALCHEFILRNGGSIWFESTQGKGSCFWFSLPVVQTD